MLCCVCGCERAPRGPQSLPEHPDILDPTILTPEKLLEDAEEELDSWRAELLRTSPDTVAGLAQAGAAIRALRRDEGSSKRGPVTIAASFGKDYAGKPYLSVIAFVPSRELTGVRIAFADREGEVRLVRIDLRRKCRSTDCIDQVYFRRAIAAWDELKRCIPGTLSLSLEEGQQYAEVPWPGDSDGVSAAVAVEDKAHGIGNFVLVQRYDAPDAQGLDTGGHDQRP